MFTMTEDHQREDKGTKEKKVVLLPRPFRTVLAQCSQLKKKMKTLTRRRPNRITPAELNLDESEKKKHLKSEVDRTGKPGKERQFLSVSKSTYAISKGEPRGQSNMAADKTISTTNYSGKQERLQFSHQGPNEAFRKQALIVEAQPSEVGNNTPFISESTPQTVRDVRNTSLNRSNRYERLDNMAKQLAGLGWDNLNQVADRLTSDCFTDLQKVRVLFRWVVETDLRNKKFTARTPRQWYHQLFQKLCRFVGLRCEIIFGLSKGRGYTPGMRIGLNSFRNCWTAVVIDGTWRLVNVTWAARQIPKSTCEIDEFYFLTDPKDYIYQHFPFNRRWQLLENPISMETFCKLPVLKSPFFYNGLDLVDNSLGDTFSERGELEILVPENVEIGVCLSGTENGETFKDQVSMRRDGSTIFIKLLASPSVGYLTVYAGKNSVNLESACCFLVDLKDYAETK